MSYIDDYLEANAHDAFSSMDTTEKSCLDCIHITKEEGTEPCKSCKEHLNWE